MQLDPDDPPGKAKNTSLTPLSPNPSSRSIAERKSRTTASDISLTNIPAKALNPFTPPETRTPDGKGGWLENAAAAAVAETDGGSKVMKKSIQSPKEKGKKARDDQLVPPQPPVRLRSNNSMDAPLPVPIVEGFNSDAETAKELMKEITTERPSASPSPSRPVTSRAAFRSRPVGTGPVPMPMPLPVVAAAAATVVADKKTPDAAPIPDKTKALESIPEVLVDAPAAPAPPTEGAVEDAGEKGEGKEKKKKKKKDKEHKKHRRKTDSIALVKETPAPIVEVPPPPPAPPTPADVTEKRTSIAQSEPIVEELPAPAVPDGEAIEAFEEEKKLALEPEKPDPLGELGPVRKLLPLPKQKPPLTALMMGVAVNKRRFGETTVASIIPKQAVLSMSMLTQQAMADTVPVGKTDSAPSVPGVEGFPDDALKAVSSFPDKKKDKKKDKKEKDKKKKKKRDKKESVVDSQVPGNSEPGEPAAPASEPAANESDEREGDSKENEPVGGDEAAAEDAGQGSKKKRKKKKRKDSGENASDGDEKKARKKKKRRGTAPPGESQAKSPVKPAKPEAPPAKVDELFGKAVGNFFILEDVLGKGGFGEARRGRHITTGKKYAIKLERIKDANDSLAEEYKIYQQLGMKPGFPRCYYFGSGPKENNALVMDLLGPSLEDYFRAMDRKWSLKTCCMAALQVLERIEFLHSKGYVYSDIKPENFLVGLAEEKQDGLIFLIDFGLAQLFKDKETGKYSYDENLKTHPVGTMRYMSVRSHEARSLSYRDDLESIGYLIIYFLVGKLPWQGLAMKDRQKKVKAVGMQKKNMPVEELCAGCPPEMQEYMKYVRSIQFYAEPKYERLRTFFINILAQNKLTDDGVFDWMGNVYDFGKNRKSESILGGKAAAAGSARLAGSAGAVAAAGGTDEEEAKPKRHFGEMTDPKKDPERSPKRERKKREKREKRASDPPATVAAPVGPAVKKPPEAPTGSVAGPSPKGTKGLPLPVVAGQDPAVDPIIAFTEQEADRPLRPSPTPSATTPPRDKRPKGGGEDSGGCCTC